MTLPEITDYWEFTLGNEPIKRLKKILPWLKYTACAEAAQYYEYSGTSDVVESLIDAYLLHYRHYDAIEIARMLREVQEIPAEVFSH